MEIKATGFETLTEKEMNEVEGGALGTAIVIGYGAYRLYRIPAVRKVVNNTVKAGIAGAGAYVGWSQTK